MYQDSYFNVAVHIRMLYQAHSLQVDQDLSRSTITDVTEMSHHLIPVHDMIQVIHPAHTRMMSGSFVLSVSLVCNSQYFKVLILFLRLDITI